MCEPTREHVIPAWFPRAVGAGRLETFNARNPLGHMRGHLLVKDVCASCNNILLSNLDAYGQELFAEFFQHAIYYEDSVNFRCDRVRLLRWLLKLSYNSARAHNADSTLLRKYRHFMLGNPMPDIQVPLYVHLIAATDFTAKPPAPGLRERLNTHDILAPCWFRLTQFRPPRPIQTNIVQRQVYINSFCFTLLVPDPDRNDHLNVLPRLRSHIEEWLRDIVEIRDEGQALLTAKEWHGQSCMEPMMSHYPTRYGSAPQSASPEFSNIIRGMVTGSTKATSIAVTREEIERGDTSETVQRLRELVRTRETAMAACQRIVLFVDGYDDDPRPVWEIHEARAYFQRVFGQCPYLFFLAMPEHGNVTCKLLALCCCTFTKAADGLLHIDHDQLLRFFNAGFAALNDLTRRLAISIEVNNLITDSVLAAFAPTNRDS